MHDPRYKVTKNLADSGPAWANGCDQCSYGIVSAPELTGAASFYMERLVQAIDHQITFCTCQAGQRYRVSLLNRRQALLEEARKDKRMSESAQQRTHPDIESTRLAVMEAYAKSAPVPTVHFEAEAVPA